MFKLIKTKFRGSFHSEMEGIWHLTFSKNVHQNFSNKGIGSIFYYLSKGD